MRKFRRFYKKGFNNRGKKPPLKKGGQSSSLFKARCFECNSTNHFIANCPKVIRKEKGALEAKLEALKKKKKGKGLIGAWDQDSSESEGEEKANLCFMTLENEVQYSLSNLSNLVDDNDDDLTSLLIEMYHELEKITKKNKELKNKMDNLSNENSKLVCENKTLFESLEILKKEKDFSKLEFQKLALENKKLCEKVLSLEKCMVDYNDLKKKVSDLTLCVEKFTKGKGKENFEKLIGSQRSPFDKNAKRMRHFKNLSNFSKRFKPPLVVN
ncbi:hypothetical protein M9H77_13106 [Catharanthus roseus]|uniref:Uncharacterized protein n=1 Tax=Catharanthus roseus TaxID=4058 RepID=A0ACC0BJ98_CATRO|nr:hypothetical protein M9H77_13106 [Catharanthus roseus]